jgi:hypothetical protein
VLQRGVLLLILGDWQQLLQQGQALMLQQQLRSYPLAQQKATWLLG